MPTKLNDENLNEIVMLINVFDKVSLWLSYKIFDIYQVRHIGLRKLDLSIPQIYEY